MGTDIHGVIQTRWDKDFPYRTEGPIEDNRNYFVFAMLANVHNGTGFAGVLTHEPVTPISDPRGLPADMAHKDGDYAFGDHSMSWVTLTEVINWPGWDKKLKRTSLVEREEWRRMQDEGETIPHSFCDGAWGPDVVIVTPEEAVAGAKFSYVQYEWETETNSQCPTFLLWTKYLEAKYDWLLAYDSAAVRLVFGFD